MHEFLKNPALKVDATDQSFITMRKGVPLDRPLFLWKRDSLTSSSTKKLMVHYFGKKGIDDGAIQMEFLDDTLSENKRSLSNWHSS